MPDQMTAHDFAQKVRTKYPGAYDSLSDDDLVSKIVTKYPQYKDQIAPAEQKGFFGRMMDKGDQLTNWMLDKGESGIKHIGSGEYAKGAHEIVQGASPFGIAALPLAATTAPLATGLGLIGGTAGGAAAHIGTKALGGTDDQADLAGDIGGVVGGGLGSSAAGPSRVGQSVKAIATPFAKTALSTAENTPVIGGLIRGVKTFGEVPGKLKSIWNPAKLEPEVVPPGEQASSPYRKSGDQIIDATTVTPRQILGPERQLMAPASAGQNPVPLEVAPQVKAKPQIAGPSKPQLPNATFLRDDIRSQTQQPPVTPRPERLLQSLREWDLTRRVNDEMNAQIGSPEEENVQAFIKAHDWKGAGAKPSIAGPTAVPPAAKFNDPAPLPEALKVAGPDKPAINVRPDPSARQPLTQRGTVPQGQTARTLGREGEYALQETKNTPPVEIGSTEWTPERMQQQIDAIKAQKARAARNGR